MIEKTLAKRYAAALLRATDAEGSTEQTEQFLLALKQAYLTDKNLRAFLSSPKMPRSRKKTVLRKAFEGRSKSSFLDFLSLLVDKNRLNIIPDIADLFDRLADASKGIVKVKVRSWKPLSDAQQTNLSDRLAKLTGKKIKIDAETDAALMGGMLVHIGDSIIDGTVAHRLKQVGERFRELQRR